MSNITGIDELKEGIRVSEIEEKEKATLLEAVEFVAPICLEDGDPMLERMADEAHQIWANWMEYMFSKGMNSHNRGEGCWLMHKKDVERWRRQMKTPYTQLSEDEKQSDREIARRYLDIALSEKYYV